MKKKLIVFVTSLCCVFSCMGIGAFADTSYADGTYTGSALGMNDDITVEVTISSGEISNIKIINHSDDEPYISDAQDVIDRIISTQSTDVDAVSGATYSSNGIIEAVKQALSDAEQEETEPEEVTVTEAETTEENIEETTISDDSNTTTTTTVNETTSADTASENDTTTNNKVTTTNSSNDSNSSSNNNSTSSKSDDIATESTATQTGDNGLLGIITTAIVCVLATVGVSKIKKSAKK